MSISLPNGTILAAPSSSHAQVSAAVTRILHLSNFAKELKTRDLQAMFKDYEAEKGGFRIKWVDDVNALVVFSDATVAKRAYLSLLLNPPAVFLPPASIRPYDKPDAAQIIASLAARTMGHRSSMSSAALTSGNFANLLASSSANEISGLPPASHGRAMSMSTSNSGSGLSGFTMPLRGNMNERSSSSSSSNNAGLPHRASIAGGGSTARLGTHHSRTGSASSSWARQSMGSGVLNFSMPTSSSIKRLPTHSEASSADPSRSSSTSNDDPTIIMDSHLPRTGTKTGGYGGPRRESVSADKALREVQEALASVKAS